MNDRAAGGPRIRVRGHCPPGSEATVRAAPATAPADTAFFAALADLPGHFSVTVEYPDRDIVLVSRSGAVAHFYDTRAPRAHGACLADVLAAAGREPRWHAEAVADHLVHGHPLGDATLDADVRRVPAGAVVTLTHDAPALVTPPAATRPADSPASPTDTAHLALTALRTAVRAAADVPCALSMSGGLDARLLLAALLADGVRPRLLISGVPGSFDRTVAVAIARDLGLPHQVHTVAPTALLAGAARTARATDGLLPLSNWAGMAHVAESIGAEPILFGYHGELARAHHLPAVGRRAWPLSARPASEAPGHLVARSGGDPFLPPEHHRLADDLREALRPRALEERIRAAIAGDAGPDPDSDAGRGTLLAATETFFRTQYGRRKIAVNLAAIGTCARWRVPLLDPAWSDAVQRLPRHWKLGDRWHRWAIDRLHPELLRYPEERWGATTTRRPPPRYWLRGPGLPDTPFYADQVPLRTESPLMAELARVDAGGLAPFIDPSLVGQLIREQARSSARPHLSFALAALAGWSRNLTRTG
ncbi:asparagine synthase-related protein [Streptomyces sp. NPDC057939]|uniref:asparagine synthase-related protein n=1 Tax=Streptomyces sp. NPDC057939 TaxID=3346284 RepID=UPI0036E5F620